MRTNGNQWEANGKAVGKLKRYVFPFVINGNSMVNHWEYLSGTYFDSVLMGDQFHITGYILMVLITIHLLGEFNGISLRIL